MSQAKDAEIASQLAHSATGRGQTDPAVLHRSISSLLGGRAANQGGPTTPWASPIFEYRPG